MTSRIVQTVILLAALPFCWLYGMVVFSLVSIGGTCQAVGKIWR